MGPKRPASGGGYMHPRVLLPVPVGVSASNGKDPSDRERERARPVDWKRICFVLVPAHAVHTDRERGFACWCIGAAVTLQPFQRLLQRCARAHSPLSSVVVSIEVSNVLVCCCCSRASVATRLQAQLVFFCLFLCTPIARTLKRRAPKVRDQDRKLLKSIEIVHAREVPQLALGAWDCSSFAFAKSNLLPACLCPLGSLGVCCVRVCVCV